MSQGEILPTAYLLLGAASLLLSMFLYRSAMRRIGAMDEALAQFARQYNENAAAVEKAIKDLQQAECEVKAAIMHQVDPARVFDALVRRQRDLERQEQELETKLEKETKPN